LTIRNSSSIAKMVMGPLSGEGRDRETPLGATALPPGVPDGGEDVRRHNVHLRPIAGVTTEGADNVLAGPLWVIHNRLMNPIAVAALSDQESRGSAFRLPY
jgi:hypothetical protein